MPKRKPAKPAIDHALQQSYEACAEQRGRMLLYQHPESLKWIAKGRASKRLYAWAQKIAEGEAVNSEALAAWIDEWITLDAQRLAQERHLHNAVLLAQLTPYLAEHLDVVTWGHLVTHQLDWATIGNDLHPNEAPLEFVIACAELPIVLQSYHPPLLESLGIDHAVTNAIVSLEKSLGDDELPHANMLCRFQELLASWTRLYFALQIEPDGRPCPEDIEVLFQQCARNSLLLSRNDHEIMCTHGVSSPGWKRLRELAVTLAGEPSDKRLLCTRQPKSASRIRSYAKYALPEMSYQSDWSECAIARCSWDVGSMGIYVTHARSMRIEVEGENGLIISNMNEPRIVVDDESDSIPLDRISDWTCTGWFNDHEAVYMEFESRFSSDVTVQRQFVMAKDQAVVLIADAVICEGDDELSYSCDYELSDRLQLFESEEHSEGFVMGQEPEALVLPLRLSEWRDTDQNEFLRKTEAGFEYSINRRRGSLYAPVLLSLSRDAGTEPYTWRQLSVAEGLSKVAESVAVGYRAQLGESQWLIYRSLGPAASRSVLGQNTTTEFLFGAVDEQGEFHQYVGVEGVMASG